MNDPDPAQAFAFSSADYDGLLHTTLGRFDFQSLPTIFPEAHTAFESAAMNQIHLLATAEHEQIHDMLARQTTHGYLILLGTRFARQIAPEAAEYVLPPLLELHHEARAIHEAYAVFGTLCANRLYLGLLDTLTPEYLGYRQKAEAMLPPGLEGSRLGRNFTYAAVLIALSPPIPTPRADLSPAENLLAAIASANGCEQRWEKLLNWKNRHPETARALCQLAAVAEGYSAPQLDLPIFFDAAPEILSPEDLSSIEERESRLIQRLMLDLSAQALPDMPPPIVVSTLPDTIRPWRNLLAPQFRIETRFAETIGIDALRLGYLDRVFQENIRSVQLPGPVPTVHSWVKNYGALNRIAAHCFDSGMRLHVCGYITDSLSEASRRNFLQHLDPGHQPLHIQWNLLSADLNVYKKEKLQVLFSFDHDTVQQLEPETAGRFLVLVSPADLHEKTTFQSLCHQLAARSVHIFVFQPLNFLSFLEWRLEKGLSIANFSAKFVHFEGENTVLMRVRFEGEDYEHLRLISLSTLLGVDNLREISFFNIECQHIHAPSEIDVAAANFLKLAWR